MKSIVLSSKCKNVKKDSDSLREKFKKIKIDNSNNILDNLRIHENQVNYIKNIFLENDFPEKEIIIKEIKTKLSNYKQQDKKKDFQDHTNLITLENIIEKLLICKLKCYYCKKNMFIFFEKVRDENQWTLDRINNYDEHSNENTIICCLKCNLQRRRKNSDKFLFTKQLETNQIIIKKNN